jgi:hypothetical protein
MRFRRTLVIAASTTLLATGIALGQGAGGGPGGQGGMGTSAGSDAPAVGGGSPAGAVGGGPPAGRVGGGPPTSAVAPSPSADNSSTTGGVIDNSTGVRPPGTINSDLGGAKPSPPASGLAQTPMPPAEVRGFAEQAPSSTTGLSRPAEDGISTKTVPARPCSTAAKGTDGTTTCVGIPVRSGVAEWAPSSTTELARPAEDSISTKTVPARPCSTAAKETDGTTTCIGIPVRR